MSLQMEEISVNKKYGIALTNACIHSQCWIEITLAFIALNHITHHIDAYAFDRFGLP